MTVVYITVGASCCIHDLVFFLNIYRYSAQTLGSQSLLLMTIIYKEASNVTIVVNCEKMVVGSMILNEIKNRLLKV